MAARLAIPRFFLFRTPFPEERGHCPVVCGDQAHLRSHSGPGASAVLLGCPTSSEYQLQPETFRVFTLERLRLPIHVTEARCLCGAPLDQLGRHRGTCPRSGRLKSRAVPTERTLARVCREAGAVCAVQRQIKGHERDCPSRGRGQLKSLRQDSQCSIEPS